jgi:hypothetical protein
MGEGMVDAVDAVLGVFGARPGLFLGPPARVGMTLELPERRVHVGERRGQVTHRSFVEAAFVAQLDADAIHVTQPIAHGGRLRRTRRLHRRGFAETCVCPPISRVRS